MNVYDTQTATEWALLSSKNMEGFRLADYCEESNMSIWIGIRNAQQENNVVVAGFDDLKEVHRYTLSTPVLSAHLNFARLILVEKLKIHIYDVLSGRRLHIIETEPNPRGLALLSENKANCHLVYPLNAEVNGDVCLFDALRVQPLRHISAHTSPLSVMVLSSNGALLATASSKGTVVRLFPLPEGSVLASLRRGLRQAEIRSLWIAPNGTSLLALSATTEGGTVHLFRTPPTNGLHSPSASPASVSVSGSGQSQSIASYMGISEYLPTAVYSLWERPRAEVTLHVTLSPLTAALLEIPPTSSNSHHSPNAPDTAMIAVAATARHIFTAPVPAEAGGDCSANVRIFKLAT